MRGPPLAPVRALLVIALFVAAVAPPAIADEGNQTPPSPPPCPDGSPPKAAGDGTYVCEGPPPEGWTPPPCPDGSAPRAAGDGTYVCEGAPPGPWTPPPCPDGSPPKAAEDGTYVCEGAPPEGWTPPPCPDGSEPSPAGDGVYVCEGELPPCPDGSEAKPAADGYYYCGEPPPQGFMHGGTPTCPAGWTSGGSLEEGTFYCESPHCTFHNPNDCPLPPELAHVVLCDPGAAEPSGCLKPPPMPPFCGEGESPAFDAHGFPSCLPPPKFFEGKYVPPGHECVQDTATSFACAPVEFAPPPDPADGQAYAAWEAHVKEHAPPAIAAQMLQAAQRWASVPEEERRLLASVGQQHGLFAPPVFDGKALKGAFVEASLDGQGLALANYTFQGAKFFESVVPAVDDKASISTAGGSSVFAGGAKASVETHNNGAGLFTYRAHADAYNVDVALAEGATVRRDGDLTFVETAAGRGVFIAKEAQEVEGKLQLSVAPDKPAVFMALPERGMEADTRLDIARGVAKGHVGAELTVVGGAGEGDPDGKTVSNYVDYTGVALEVIEALDDTVKLRVASEEEAGKSVVVTVSRASLKVPISQTRILLDGEELEEALTLEELMDPATGSGKFFLTANATAMRVAVGVPSFSVHEIDITSASRVAQQQEAEQEAQADPPASEEDAQPSPTPAEPPVEPADTPGAAPALVAVTLGLLAFARRRR